MNYKGLTLYIEREILPRYNGFDKAHREDHARMVIAQSLDIARHYALNMILGLPSTGRHIILNPGG